MVKYDLNVNLTKIKMKIGYDAKRLFHNATGLGNYSRDLVRIMATYYPKNQYLLYNPKPASINRFEKLNSTIIREPKGKILKKIPALWRSKFINKDLLKDQPDIFHGLSGELPFGIQKTGVKSIVTIHDLIFIRYPELYKPIDRMFYKAKFKYATNVADQIVAISEQTKSDLVNFFKIEPEKIKVIYQGCHQAFKMSYSAEFKNSLRQKFQLPQNFILNVGTIEPRKNAFSIVKALKGTAFNLVLVGRQTKYASKIHTYINKHNMTKQIFFLEALSLKELAALYQMADMFIYPSIFEGFGIPIIEALYSRIPVITNRDGVFPEAAGPKAFYLDNVLNPLEIKEKIKQIYNSNVSENIIAGYDYAQKFNDDNIAMQWQALYKEILKK